MRPATPPVLWSEYDNPDSGLGNALVLWNEYGNPGSGLGNPLVLCNEYGNPGSGLGNPLVLWNEYGNPGSGLGNPLVLWSEYDNPGSGLGNLQTVYNAISRLAVVCLVLPLSLARFHYLSLSNYKCGTLHREIVYMLSFHPPYFHPFFPSSSLVLVIVVRK